MYKRSEKLLIFAHKAVSLCRQSTFVKLWFFPAWLLLGLSKALIFFVPFGQLAPLLGKHASVAEWLPLVNGYQELRALQIGRTVRLAAKYTPWDSSCFPQALTARLLLGLYRTPYILFFGLCPNSDKSAMKAHAWIASGKVQVTGGAASGQFNVVGLFVSYELQSIVIP